ncbi:MAG: GntR family transcriptional regulator [Sphaerochaetaceae bacterium]|jgi:DNA-binding GntR family transcriptional regulator|nr:GntR family transcriptional regulator [Sphaerochaetaceae bacterium]NLO60641.1 GntR family transcriptional regulator [Spirochaetales bacterium]
MPFVVYEEKMDHESAKEFALRVLKRNIMRLDMLPGEAISEKEIAKELDLSRTPVREALLELSREHLVDIYPQKSTKVSLMDARIVEQGRFVRATVEVAILEQACRQMDSEYFEELEENLERQARCIEENDLLKFFTFDNEFHQILFNAASLDTVYEVLSIYVPHFSRERMLRLQMFNATELYHDHKTILNALREKDCRNAQLTMRRHIDRVVCDQNILKEAFPAYFTQV